VSRPSLAERSSRALEPSLTFRSLLQRYMNLIAFNGATGETLLFFLVQGFATIAYSWLRRTFPSLVKACPRWLGVVIVNIWAYATAPLFCEPFLREGWFEDLKGFGVAGPIKGFVVTLAALHVRDNRMS